MSRLISTILLAALLLMIAPSEISAYEVPEQGQEDPCAWCGYIPQWCWLCYMLEWWDIGCFPGDPGCIDW